MSKLTKQGDYFRAWYHGKPFYGRTEAEAIKKRDEYKYECEHGIEKPEPVNVFDLVEKWMKLKVGIDRRTFNQYATIMEKMTDLIGEKYVHSVTASDIREVWAEYNGLSQSYISKAKFLYKGFFQYAIDNKHCISNPMLAPSSKPHKGTKGSHRCLTATEINLIETVPHRVQCAAMFMLKAGLRRGEVLALKRSDIHDGRIWVERAVKFVNNRPVVGDTKNESSDRSVPLFAVLKPFSDGIQKYAIPDEHGDICSETAFRRAWESYMTDLSTAYNGEHKRWYHLTKEWKQEHQEEYAYYLKLKNEGKRKEAEEYRLRGYRDISFRPHDLRHTFVTVCRDRGIDIHVCMNWCGHSSEKMILEIYDHLSEEREQNACAIMNSAPTTV